MHFIDSVKIFLQAGKGGDGCIAFRREKFIEYGGPNGGNGGDGGNIYIQGEEGLNTLIDFRYKQHFKLPSAQKGMKSNKHGANGEDLIIKVPLGTTILDDTKQLVLHDITNTTDKVLLVSGGRGGRGNATYKNSVNRSPREYAAGELGEETWIWLQLKLIANIGIIGMPNAGKSTLITNITNSKSKVGNYPFTTLYPQLGQFQYNNINCTIADIPGLIKGANDGRGLGNRFLNHITRCKLLIILLDINDNAVEQYKSLIYELEQFDKELVTKVGLIVLNKIDSINERDATDIQSKLAHSSNIKVITHSSFIPSYLDNIREVLASLISKQDEEDKQKSNNKAWSPLD